MREANAMIKDFIALQNSALGNNFPSAFIDINQKMLNESGEPIPEIFLDDSLHMNSKGYAIWKKEIEPFLMK
jgi:lysophospholipase L1-like esterase